MNEHLPDDSWFTDEELSIQKARNIHGRFWQDLAVDNPHRETPAWWVEEGREAYRLWTNETHQCDECEIWCDVADLLDQLNND